MGQQAGNCIHTRRFVVLWCFFILVIVFCCQGASSFGIVLFHFNCCMSQGLGLCHCGIIQTTEAGRGPKACTADDVRLYSEAPCMFAADERLVQLHCTLFGCLGRALHLVEPPKTTGTNFNTDFLLVG